MSEREKDKSVEALTLRHNRTDWKKYWADKPIPVNGFNEHLKKYCIEAGVRAFSSHKARFYVATSLFDAGLSDFQIASYLGHSDTSTSHIYDRRSKEIKIDPELLENCMGKGEKMTKVPETGGEHM